MICKCNIMMKELATEIKEDDRVIYYHCSKCGRILCKIFCFYSVEDYTTEWIEPEYLKKEPLSFLKVDIS